MIKLITDHPEYANDIAEEIRLFYSNTEVDIVSSDDTLRDGDVIISVFLKSDGREWISDAHYRGVYGARVENYDYSYTMPAVNGSELIVKRYEKRCVKVAVFRLLKGIFKDNNTPWGSLTGIRPTRLLRELTGELGESGAMRTMTDMFDVSNEKLSLAKQICDAQSPVLATQTQDDVDVYVGIPFCRTKCMYCSFASCVRTKKTDMAAYIDALCRDIEFGAQIVCESGRKVRSMYVGGGTPTVLTAQELNRVLECAIEAYGGYGNEFTVEAGRPDTIDREKLEIIRSFGAKRISINPQTMNQRTLHLVCRDHTVEDIFNCYDLARDVGFEVINMDVIVGLPEETINDVGNTFERIYELAPNNLTVHTLAIKRSSALKSQLGNYKLAQAEEVERMVELGYATAQRLGLHPYYMYRQKYMSGNLENVGYAADGCDCIYNIDMMEDTTTIMAHGAGAMTKVMFDAERRVERIPNPKDIGTYIAKVAKLAEEKRAMFTRG